MILKLLFALVFTNIIGIIFDLLRAGQSSIYRKGYVNSTLGVISMVFFRNIAEFFSALFLITTSPKKFLAESTFKILRILIFIIIIYYLIDFQHDTINKELIHLLIVAFVFWAITYSYMSVTSNFLYINDNKKTERELRMSEGIASDSDKIALFFLNLIASPLTIHIYLLALITTVYTYFIGNWIG
jgi:hypothetical protein